MKKFLQNNIAQIVKISVSVFLVVLGLALSGVSEQISILLYLIAYVVNAYKVIYKAVKELVTRGEICEKMLMTVATLGAIVTDAYFEAAFVVALYAVGVLIEDGASYHAKESVERLCRMKPARARVKKTGLLLLTTDIKVGDIIEVFAGETIPLDGKVIDGVADLDTSFVTGESTPQNVRSGAEIYAGYRNLNGVITIEVTRPDDQSMVQKIIDISLNAKERKSKAETFTKKFARIYTPSVILLAVLVAIIPSLFGLNIMTSLYKAFSLLAIACPCAVVISVPLAYFTAIGYASRRGALIKGSCVLEALSRLNTMAFDKTGTLTKPEPRVTRVEAYEKYTKMEILEIASIAECKSTHPLASAILRESNRFKIKFEEGSDYKEIAGSGVECRCKFGIVRVGSYKHAGGKSIPNPQASMYVSLNDVCVGFIGVGDNIKQNGKISFDKLREEGINKIYVLSGDKKSKVDIVASTLYADGAYSQLLPGQKLDALEDIIENGEKVRIGYCGDGINDLPCIARADVGFSIGTVSTDAAIEESDVMIVDDDLAKIPLAIKIANKTRKRIISNLIFAISAKAIIATLSIFVAPFPLFVAVLADVGVMIIAVINSLFAGRCKN